MNKKLIVLSMCLTGALVLSGCGCEKDNAELVTPSASPSPSVSASPDAEYEADKGGTVEPDKGPTDPKPGTDNNSQNGTGNTSGNTNTPAGNGMGGNTDTGTGNTSGNDSTNQDSAASEAIDDVGSAVDDLVNNAKNAVRGRR